MAEDQPKLAQGIVIIHGREYKTVALRLSEFREHHPVESGWAVKTKVIQAGEDRVIVRCDIVDPRGTTIATGHAEEKRSEGQINPTSALENCETSAVGRALSACGFPGSEYASAEEVAEALALQDQATSQKEDYVRRMVEAYDAKDDAGLTELYLELSEIQQQMYWREFNSKQKAWMRECVQAYYKANAAPAAQPKEKENGNTGDVGGKQEEGVVTKTTKKKADK